MAKKKQEEERKVHIWLKHKGKEYGVVSKGKYLSVLHHCAKDGAVDAGTGRFSFGKTKTPDDSLVLALYDKRGGLIITRDGEPVETFTFWDNLAGKPRSFKEEKPAEKKKAPAKKKASRKKKK